MVCLWVGKSIQAFGRAASQRKPTPSSHSIFLLSLFPTMKQRIPTAIPFLVNVQSPTAARYQGPRSSDVVARRTPRRSSAANHFSFEEAVTGPARDFLSPRDGLSPAVQSPRLSPNIPFSAMPRSGRRPSSDLYERDMLRTGMYRDFPVMTGHKFSLSIFCKGQCWNWRKLWSSRQPR